MRKNHHIFHLNVVKVFHNAILFIIKLVNKGPIDVNWSYLSDLGHKISHLLFASKDGK